MMHTPGPWKVQYCVPDGHIIKRDDTYQLWTPEYDVAANVPGGGPFRKLEDARLASAAPDLLDACKTTKRWLEERGFNTGEALTILNITITKAIGE